MSSAYHPESQDALERWHQTLKSVLRKFCFEKDWDESLPFVLFDVRESVQESLGFSPAELVFGHTIRGPLKVLKEKLLTPLAVCPVPKSVLEYVSRVRERLSKARALARDVIAATQAGMKERYDRKVVSRSFQPGVSFTAYSWIFFISTFLWPIHC